MACSADHRCVLCWAVNIMWGGGAGQFWAQEPIFGLGLGVGVSIFASNDRRLDIYISRIYLYFFMINSK